MWKCVVISAVGTGLEWWQSAHDVLASAIPIQCNKPLNIWITFIHPLSLLFPRLIMCRSFNQSSWTWLLHPSFFSSSLNTHNFVTVPLEIWWLDMKSVQICIDHIYNIKNHFWKWLPLLPYQCLLCFISGHFTHMSGSQKILTMYFKMLDSSNLVLFANFVSMFLIP